jgi:hypothetical protein
MIRDVWLIATPFGRPVVPESEQLRLIASTWVHIDVGKMSEKIGDQPDVKHIKATSLGADTGSIAASPLTVLLTRSTNTTETAGAKARAYQNDKITKLHSDKLQQEHQVPTAAKKKILQFAASPALHVSPRMR